MATIFIEGFDKYGPVGQKIPDLVVLMVQGEWTSYGSPGPIVVSGLSSTGTAFRYGGGTESWVSKTLPMNYARLIGGVRFQWVGAGADYGPLFNFKDITNVQCSVIVNANGTIGLVQGDYRGGTLVQSSLTSISQGTAHYLEWDITFSSAGPYSFWLDGLPVMTGTHSTITNAHSYANVFMIGNDTGQTGLNDMSLDDLYLFDTTGSHNNAPLLTNPRIETRFPNADAQTQWNNAASVLGSDTAITTSTGAPGANRLFLRKYTSSVNQTIESVSLIGQQNIGTAKYAAVIYSDVSGTPTTLLSAGVEHVGQAANVVLTSDLVSPVSLVAGTPYWIGFITDTGGFLSLTNDLTEGQVATVTYTSGAPSTPPAMTPNAQNWLIWGNCVGAATNWESLQNPSDGDLSAINSSTPGNEDLYSLPPLSASDAVIYTIGVKANFKRSDTGPRTVDLRLKSAGTDSAGSNSGLTAGTDYGWSDTYFDVDPHTSTDWSLSAANAAQAGPKVAS